MTAMQIITQTQHHLQNIAILSHLKEYTYKDLLESSKQFASFLLVDKTDLQEARVAFMVEPSFDYAGGPVAWLFHWH
jgi:malonyl-CoA/methylmalonyl-CoA synthetase